jgi:hypothetical protein
MGGGWLPPEPHVTEGNDAARRLYEQCGFEGTGQWEPLREGSHSQTGHVGSALPDVRMSAS